MKGRKARQQIQHRAAGRVIRQGAGWMMGKCRVKQRALALRKPVRRLLADGDQGVVDGFLDGGLTHGKWFE